MMLDLIGQLMSLNATVAHQAGLVNIDSLVLNGPIVIVTGTPQPDRGCNANYDDNRTMQDKGCAIIRLDDKKQSTPVSLDSKNTEFVAHLPVRFGIYIHFEDPKWWEEAPEFLDVAKALRIVSINGHCLSVPSIDSGTNRKIMINCEGNAMTISREGVASPNLHFQNVRPDGELQFQFQASGQAKWSLHRIEANKVTDLNLNSCNAVMYYRQEFAECVWLLVQHHHRRGDEAYILMRKGS